MGAEKASDEVIDEIAHIEMQRQDMEREANRAASCSLSLHKLQEILQREQEAARLPDAGTRHLANVEALAIEIRRVKQMIGAAGGSRKPQGARPGGPQAPRGDRGHRHARNRGRRTMGRPGGR